MSIPARTLLINANPFPLSIATLRHIGIDSVAKGKQVDAYDAYPGVFAHSPLTQPRDRLYERIASKYSRFLLPVINGSDITRSVRPYAYKVPPLPEKVDELRGATAFGAKVGLAALSTASSLTKIADRDHTSRYGPTLEKAWIVAHRAAAIADQLRGRYAEVYIFNGRQAETRPFCDILAEDSTVVRYEAGGQPDSFITVRGPLFDSQLLRHRVAEHPFNPNAAEHYFDSRRSRLPGTDSHRFTSNQTRGMLPHNIRSHSIVTMFTSSEDEFFAVRDTADFGVFQSQMEIALVAARLCTELGITFVIRLHPHLALKNDSWRRNWDLEELMATGATVILPDAPVDSYALVDASQAVITCGSTVGVEAAYIGRPSLMIGETYATALGICHRADTVSELKAFLRAPAPRADAKANALKFASYQATSGAPITGLTDGSKPDAARIEGTLVDPARWLVAKARKLVRFG
ncbi:hypothetical protein [Novosphingopyxis sp. YJ-S2-01]|uniref:hypothetical protein n=1 Tax=Novosphingopyxis sp. YJ-S2-01 TaxID=2794021 RepID=UPI0018DBC860|nr:hypothetical protein [Novosphingopyxis sp. YJ-S2-01]MBH9538453.1 hypothetical protein [Novosphingopyxis sp. YJ-S2-01]